MKNLLTLFIANLLITAAFGQDLKVNGTALNPSDAINDGVVELKVEGGTPPYTYEWSNQATARTSSRSMGLVEGVPYTVKVSDAAGNSVTKVFTVETAAITEVFNGVMTPAVSA